MTAKIIIMTVVAILICSVVFLTSCKAESKTPARTESYKVICRDSIFENVKKSYRPGQKVTVYFPYVATDTDYTFYLDDQRLSDYRYSDTKGYIITFTMPAHDVTLTYESKNTMENPFHTYEPGTVLVTYVKTVSTAEGNTLYRLTVEATEDESKHKMTVHTDSQTSEYLIPVFPYESCCNYILSEQLWNWNELEEYECLTGKLISLTILLDGAPVTISTDQMPPSGEQILGYLHSHFTDYIKEEYKQ